MAVEAADGAAAARAGVRRSGAAAREVRGPEAEDRRRSQGTVGAFAREGERCGAVAADLLELRCCDLSLRGEGKWRVSGLRGGTRNR